MKSILFPAAAEILIPVAVLLVIFCLGMWGMMRSEKNFWKKALRVIESNKPTEINLITTITSETLPGTVSLNYPEKIDVEFLVVSNLAGKTVHKVKVVGNGGNDISFIAEDREIVWPRFSVHQRSICNAILAELGKQHLLYTR